MWKGVLSTRLISALMVVQLAHALLSFPHYNTEGEESTLGGETDNDDLGGGDDDFDY